ncbi:MAG: exodeoxyribonuclease VII large subunit [Planctomycetia bacterium]|nr:exodeoxyribonuclease VII large subunit [Planctomycetia bacterium]
MSKWLFDEMDESPEPSETSDTQDLRNSREPGGSSSLLSERKRRKRPPVKRETTGRRITVEGIPTGENPSIRSGTSRSKVFPETPGDMGPMDSGRKRNPDSGKEAGTGERMSPTGDAPWTVSQLTERVRSVIESTFTRVSVVGEISDLSRPGSGHAYFTLKDSTSQIPGVIWRGVLQRLPFELADGLSVVCRGRLEVYPARGRYQFVIESLRPEGLGALELAFRQLHAKLSREGLFDPRRKRPIPRSICRIAVVTSPSGAAIHDFLNVLRRRGRRDLAVTVVPVRVQGVGAAEEIAAALERVNLLVAPSFDVIVLTRGGGSLDDLWSFNEECVVRAIANSQIPVISGVGHEVDVTLSDLAADFRALTPSEAAERVAPSADELEQKLSRLQERLVSSLRQWVTTRRRILEELGNRSCFRDPLRMVREADCRLDELEERGAGAIRRRVELAGRDLTMTGARLESVSPLAVLGRGYSLTQTSDGRVIRDSEGLTIGTVITTHLAKGMLRSRIEEIPEKTGAGE